jgi:hypothetical protein
MPTAKGLSRRRFWVFGVEGPRILGVGGSELEMSMIGGGRRQMPTVDGLRCRRSGLEVSEVLGSLAAKAQARDVDDRRRAASQELPMSSTEATGGSCGV